jgi:hypothetical protein
MNLDMENLLMLTSFEPIWELNQFIKLKIKGKGLQSKIFYPPYYAFASNFFKFNFTIVNYTIINYNHNVAKPQAQYTNQWKTIFNFTH